MADTNTTDGLIVATGEADDVPEGAVVGPVYADRYPELPIEAALTDEAKQALVEQGYAEGEGEEWHVTSDRVVPGLRVNTEEANIVPLEQRNAKDLVQLLRDNPAQWSLVDAAERRRPEPRSTVLEAVETARQSFADPTATA